MIFSQWGGRVKIQVVGVDYRNAPLAVRERLALGGDLMARAYQSWADIPGQTGVVVLSTCNRTETYFSGDVLLREVQEWWQKLAGLTHAEMLPFLLFRQDGEAVRHLMEVASGIDSMVLGETEILGQVKAAYLAAQQAGRAGNLHRLFQYALRVGKRARSETEIGRNALSFGHVVVELATKVFGTLKDRKALIVGAGETATLVGRHLSAQKMESILVVNRTRERGQRLAAEIGANWAGLDELAPSLRHADVIVSCTSSPTPLITREMVAQALKGRRHPFRFFFDMALPRDIDPEVAHLSQSIFLYDIDDVTAVVEANLNKRQRQIQKVKKMVLDEGRAFMEEMDISRAGSVIQSLREKAESIRQEELDKALHRLPNLSEAERAIVSDTTRLILNKFLNDPMMSIRDWSRDDQKIRYLDAVRELFRLGDDKVEVAPDGGAATSRS